MRYAYKNGILLDGSLDMKPQSGKVILTDGKRIAKIVQEDSKLSLDGYHIIDLEGKYIMPGLINMHVHLPASGKPTKKQRDNAKTVHMILRNRLMRSIGMKLCESYAKTELMSGVTTIRTVGGVADFDTRIRDLVKNEKITGPRILAANMAVSVPGGHMAGSLAYEAHSANEAVEYVKKIAGEKTDLI